MKIKSASGEKLAIFTLVNYSPYICNWLTWWVKHWSCNSTICCCIVHLNRTSLPGAKPTFKFRNPAFRNRSANMTPLFPSSLYELFFTFTAYWKHQQHPYFSLYDKWKFNKIKFMMFWLKSKWIKVQVTWQKCPVIKDRGSSHVVILPEQNSSH